MDNRTTSEILAENKRLHEQITANNVELQKRRWQSTGVQPLRMEDFVGKRVCVTETFHRLWMRGSSVGETLTVQHVNATETGWTVDLVASNGRVIRGVDFNTAQEMRRMHIRAHGEE